MYSPVLAWAGRGEQVHCGGARPARRGHLLLLFLRGLVFPAWRGYSSKPSTQTYLRRRREVWVTPQTSLLLCFLRGLVFPA